jgi:hypothetical protein
MKSVYMKSVYMKSVYMKSVYMSSEPLSFMKSVDIQDDAYYDLSERDVFLPADKILSDKELLDYDILKNLFRSSRNEEGGLREKRRSKQKRRTMKNKKHKVTKERREEGEIANLMLKVGELRRSA